MHLMPQRTGWVATLVLDAEDPSGIKTGGPAGHPLRADA